MSDAPWIAVDWGTTHLRAWSMAGGTVVAEAASDQGMNGLAREAFEPTLLDLIAPWLRPGPNIVVACGMVGSRQGWVEAPYCAVPCPPVARGGMVRALVKDPRLDVHVLPGLKQDRPPDVMRGEETQIAGLLHGEPDFDGVVCLPGTHTKWAHISAGEVVSFRTFMTGEMFALLAGQSVLRHSIAESGWDAAAFADAVSDTLSRPESIAARLFELRARGLLQDHSDVTARAQLSGFLIGAELAAARPYWLGQRVAVIGSAALTRAYGAALSAQGVNAEPLTADAMTLRGLAAAHAEIERIAP